MAEAVPIKEASTVQPHVRRLADGALHLHAAAKVNLHLAVGPRRPDGYHPLDSLVARISFYDALTVGLPRPSRPGAPGSESAHAAAPIRFACRGEPCGPDEQNLALRAARRLAEEIGSCPGAVVRLDKRIPPGRGLGGGSSDAAAVLVGLNELWQADLPPERLADLAAQLGSDVPLFLGPPAARMTGRGEQLEAVSLPPFWVVLHLPPMACSTAAVYRAFDDAGLPAAPRPAPLPEVGSPPRTWAARLRNDLTAAAERVRPELADLRRSLAAALGREVLVTGSGSGLFVLCDGRGDALAVARRVPADLPGRTVIARSNPW